MFCLGLLAYANSFENPFLIDDHAFFEGGKVTYKSLFTYFTVQPGDAYYRPLAKILPALGFMAFKSNPFGYHVMNLILFCLAAWGIYVFLTRRLNASRTCGFLAASLYLIHPINGMLVNYITASVFSAQVILMLLSLNFLMTKPAPAPACALFLLATFCHETAFALPLYAFILCFALSKERAPLLKFQEAWSRTWTLLLVLALLLIFRTFFIPLKTLTIDNAAMLNMSFAQYLATWTKLLWWYVSQLFLMRDIVLIMSQRVLTENIALWLMILAVLLGSAGYWIWKWRNNQLRLTGMSWFVLGFAPVALACLFEPVHGLMIEPHWFVFPVIGFFMVLGSLLESIWQHKKTTAQMMVAVCVLTCVLTTRWYNWVWGDEVRYCSFWLLRSPDFVGGHAFLAEAYKARGQFDLARTHYHKVLPLGFNLPLIYMNLGLMDLRDNKLASAEKNFLRLIKLDQRSSLAFNNLGAVYLKAGKYKQALRCFNKALALDPKSAMPYLNIQAMDKILQRK